MDAQLMREFRARWQAVAAIEAEEQRAASIALRWQQTNAILRLAMGLGLSLADLRDDDDDEEVVRQRWARLKGIHR